jgi:esterase/lipase superfamily enzyme/tetratricopeptide (TPR) repeat protein
MRRAAMWLVLAISLSGTARAQIDDHEGTRGEGHTQAGDQSTSSGTRYLQTLDVAESADDLGRLYEEQHRLKEAEQQFWRALEIRQKILKADDAQIALSLINLAALHTRAGQHSDAEPFINLAREMLEKADKAERKGHFVQIGLSALGQLYLYRGQLVDAEQLFKRSIAIIEEEFPERHRDVAQVLGLLADVYRQQGRYTESAALLQRALAMDEKKLGREHADVGDILAKLGVIADHQAHFKEAEDLYRRALVIMAKARGDDHINVAIVRANLGGLLKSQGRRAEAEPLLTGSLATMEKVYGRDHARVAQALAQLADLFRLEGRCDAAEPLILRARSIGAAGGEEIPVLFGTDRKRNATPPLAFGVDRAGDLSFGLAIVTVPPSQPDLPSVLRPSTGRRDVGTLTTAARYLALQCMEIATDRQIVETAMRRLEGSKTFRNEALVFVHGYNVSFDNAVRRAAQIAYDLEFDGAIFLFSWPSRARWLSYFSDRETVDVAAEHLKEFLEQIVGATKVTKVHFVAHSMGNMVLLRALEQIAVAEGSVLRGAIGEIIHASPDVDPDLFKLIVTKLKTSGANVTLYASASDKALWLSSLLRDRPRAGYISGETPAIIAGVDTIDITSAGTGIFSLNHDVYSNSPTIVGDMRRIVEHGERPPDKRTKDFEMVQSKEGTYWRLRLP